ncbi:MAG TPA: M20/M25/M40 family metallo-hydrolase [Vicinamibacterales bacterium]|nr:M20/M25/M40 family metallo-hydrolase [Vicinamibacterales bacterium]
MLHHAAAALAFVILFDAHQSARVPRHNAAADIGSQLLRELPVKTAIDRLKSTEPQLLDEQIRLCEIPAPPFKESHRAEALRQSFQSLGLKNVRIDRAGNVLGERAGTATGPHLVLSAHLDTVFGEDVAIRMTRAGSILKGPGISDDCRGLAVLLGVVRALEEAQIQTPGPITFVGTVGEEGLGDLRGVKELFNGELKGRIDRFVSIDGAGLGITHIGVGSLRYRVTFKGAGGHSYGDFGLANPVHALGRAMARIADLEVPTLPKTTFNVGRVGGGTSVNAIASEAWMEVDLRSSDRAALAALDASLQKALDAALKEENDRWENRGRLTVSKATVGNRPAGRVSADAPIVQAAVSVTRALGLPVSLDEGSTDSNLAMSLGIPAITIDGGGKATATHSTDETFDSTNSWQGTQRAVLLAIALAR